MVSDRLRGVRCHEPNVRPSRSMRKGKEPASSPMLNSRIHSIRPRCQKNCAHCGSPSASCSLQTQNTERENYLRVIGVVTRHRDSVDNTEVRRSSANTRAVHGSEEGARAAGFISCCQDFSPSDCRVNNSRGIFFPPDQIRIQAKKKKSERANERMLDY